MAAVFPRHRFLLDRCHLLEHLHEWASALEQGDAGSDKAWVTDQAGRIDAGGVAGVAPKCRSWAGANAGDPLNRLADCLENRQDQLDYTAACREGLTTGSGAVERGHRDVI